MAKSAGSEGKQREKQARPSAEEQAGKHERSSNRTCLRSFAVFMDLPGDYLECCHQAIDHGQTSTFLSLASQMNHVYNCPLQPRLLYTSDKICSYHETYKQRTQELLLIRSS